MNTLSEFFRSDYLRHHFDLRATTIMQMQIAINIFSRMLRRPALVEDLCDDSLLDLNVWMKSEGRAPRTINSKRQILISLWQHAHFRGYISKEAPTVKRVPCAKVSKRNPTSWEHHEFQSLLDACVTFPETGFWGTAEWQSLLLACYDTGERIGALLQTPVRNLNLHRGTLIVDAAVRKTDEDMVHFLHPQTVEAIKPTLIGSTGSRLLFNWPFCRRYLYKKLGQLLAHAGLPDSRRDKFHRIRRTGFTQMFILAGHEAAKAYAGHKTDMSIHYLDRTKLPVAKSVELLPRPAI